MKLINTILIIFCTILFVGCAANNISEESSNQSEIKVDENTQVETNVAGAEVKVEGNQATVSYENKTVKAENLTITTNEDGVYEVNLSVKNNVSLPPEMPIEQWCIAGQTYGFKNEQGQATEAKIIGISEYKSKTYCKASSTTKVYDMEILTTYYFNYGAKDIWAVVNLGGTVNEVHINNN